MFREDEDWNDESDAEILRKSVLSHSQRAKIKVKDVGKKSLLRTLQTLGSVPEWKCDIHQQSSDSEIETTPLHTKRKKKRRKRQKRTAASGEEPVNDTLDQTVQEEHAVKKKKDASGTPTVITAPICEAKDEKPVTSAKMEVNQTERLSRKHWKSKMKNKRKCKNKYRQNTAEGEENKTGSPEKPKPKKEVTSNHIGNTRAMENNCSAQTRKMTNDETKICSTSKTQPHGKQQQTEKKKINSSANESSIAGGAAEKGYNEETEHHNPMKKEKLEQRRKPENLQKILHSQEPNKSGSPTVQEDQMALSQQEVRQDPPTSFRSRMEQRLEAARFRYINEVLYTTSSGQAKRMFKQDPQAFWVYHKGYTAQVQRWPANPVDAIIAYIQKKPASLVVADFGCGDCKIARSVKNKVHSFDLAAVCELVTVCDMAKVPLDDGTVDIAVFCLSLMGTNLADFISEANRVLVKGGVLKIAEVASRFDNVRSFITALAKLGFKLMTKDTGDTHFFSFEFLKTANTPESVKKFGLELKPCVYKKR
ncbi:ribosomal RNA-processing protein 8 isoform X2 [Thalassophryne amazonica]|uniref:ribosomal RNA-processing protein 8 isoform X2 n=1 Tax=Thalassophryne amazonica TaxID=390379 RepID=UPI0014716BA3|nr:ribosomal RNA-processing protein 8 isoform X2 [Thalassophryne amazonica]